MREDDDIHSRRVRFYPFELDFTSGELCKNGRRIRLQRQPLLILRALLAKPGEIVKREELRDRIWPGNVFVDYEHSLNRSMNKLRHALGDRVVKPRYVETVHGRGYRFIAPVEDGGSPQPNRLAVLPVENLTGLCENDDLADEITEALIDELGRTLGQGWRPISLATSLHYKKKRMRVAKLAAELRAGYLVFGRLRSEDNLSRLHVELVDASDHTARWAGSFLFARDNLGLVQNEICNQIADHLEVGLVMPRHLASTPDSVVELQQAE